jgi:hypothetical protein
MGSATVMIALLEFVPVFRGAGEHRTCTIRANR